MGANFLAVGTILALGAFCFWMGSGWQSAKGQAALSQCVARGELAARLATETAIAQTQEVNDERIAELVQITQVATARPATVIRVCNVPAAAGGQGAAPGDAPGPGSGLVPAGDGSDLGTDLDFSTQPLYDLARYADEVSADLRACQAAWPR